MIELMAIKLRRFMALGGEHGPTSASLYLTYNRCCSHAGHTRLDYGLSTFTQQSPDDAFEQRAQPACFLSATLEQASGFAQTLVFTALAFHLR